jgi:hypothetical protein
VSRNILLWGAGVLVAFCSVAILTPDRVGEGLWSAVRIPVAVFLFVTWVGFVLAVIAQLTKSRTAETLVNQDIEPFDAIKPGETLVASARLGARLTVLGLGLACVALAVWDSLFRTPPHWLRTGIWVSAAVALGVHLLRLMHRRVVLAPSAISWRHHGHAMSRKYDDVADLQVKSGSEIRVVFLDGEKLDITSDMADLKKVLAALTTRRVS